MKKQNILTGAIASMMVTLVLSQASYANESNNNASKSSPLSVRTQTHEVAMFNKQGKPHKHPTGKKINKPKKVSKASKA
ncbi:hypothetical protein [Chamaesiphon minutus]|uniref:Uncharacterized protein n=1 Tax=Chamaesiphon minutus (strain ATCC 27169 / PCC 6605) TaxID=1173020 RepID=K9UR00_CHAP6|nr:hypothetical protein [Chamaesiphon minutus]AFY96871.1 hypothetical protein Cha6605_6031 [Chamaesiphon minutus PCC 6605]